MVSKTSIMDSVLLGDNTVRKIDVRVVAATNEDLAEAVRENRFRSDLFYRLSAYPMLGFLTTIGISKLLS